MQALPPGTSAGKILLIVHQQFSDPGRMGAKLQALGYELDLRCPMLGAPLPSSMDDHEAVVVFGGPMSANDDHLDGIRAELDWIPRAVESGKPYLGICLGAQLLARAGGARVAPHPDGWHEIGYYRINPTNAGRHLFDPDLHVYQWHGEGFDLPRQSTLLAEGGHFPNQAFHYSDQAYGLQFHPEVTPAMQKIWGQRGAHRLVLPGAQARDEQARQAALHDTPLGHWLDRFLQHWLPLSAASSPVARAV